MGSALGVSYSVDMVRFVTTTINLVRFVRLQYLEMFMFNSQETKADLCHLIRA